MVKKIEERKRSMFEKFGEFDTVEELNMAAEGLKKEGDIKSLHELAKENGIAKEDVEDYVSGELDELADEMSAAIGKLEVEKEKANEYEKIIADYMITQAADTEVARAIRRKGKTVKGALAEMEKQARKKAVNGMAMITDREGYGIVKKYYLKKEVQENGQDK